MIHIIFIVYMLIGLTYSIKRLKEEHGSLTEVNWFESIDIIIANTLFWIALYFMDILIFIITNIYTFIYYIKKTYKRWKNY